jgi:hypothetical protein
LSRRQLHDPAEQEALGGAAAALGTMRGALA